MDLTEYDVKLIIAILREATTKVKDAPTILLVIRKLQHLIDTQMEEEFMKKVNNVETPKG